MGNCSTERLCSLFRLIRLSSAGDWTGIQAGSPRLSSGIPRLELTTIVNLQEKEFITFCTLEFKLTNFLKGDLAIVRNIYHLKEEGFSGTCIKDTWTKPKWVGSRVGGGVGEKWGQLYLNNNKK